MKSKILVDLLEHLDDAIDKNDDFKISVITRRLELMGYVILPSDKSVELQSELNNETDRRYSEL